MTYKLCQNTNFKNGGTTILMGILLVLLNFCQYLYCLGYMTGLAISRCEKCSRVILHFEEINEMQVAS